MDNNRNSFSQRMGFEPIKKEIQIDSMDDDLRNGLWNVLTIVYWGNFEKYYSDNIYDNYQYPISNYPNLEVFCKLLCIKYYKKTLDSMTGSWVNFYNDMRNYFFNCKWNKVYDFLEFVAENFPDSNEKNISFQKDCNSVLEKEFSGYRFIEKLIVPITNKEEISEIEKALSFSDKFKPVSQHLKDALQKLSDRESPDYKNSIKESISAVESMCNLITGSKTSLGNALKKLEKHIKIHTALKNGFIKIYGYTSDEDGIRHGMLDIPNIDFEDAQYFLVSCSAFINYLKSKTLKANIF